MQLLNLSIKFISHMVLHVLIFISEISSMLPANFQVQPQQIIHQIKVKSTVKQNESLKGLSLRPHGLN